MKGFLFASCNRRTDSPNWEGERGRRANQSIMGPINSFLDYAHSVHSISTVALEPEKWNTTVRYSNQECKIH